MLTNSPAELKFCRVRTLCVGLTCVHVSIKKGNPDSTLVKVSVVVPRTHCVITACKWNVFCFSR